MANIYNSKLIADLYQFSSEDRVKEILSEMSEIKDSVFLYPVAEVYKKFRESSIAHYFLSLFEDFDDPEALKIILDIMEDPNFNHTRHFAWAIKIPLKHNYISEKLVEESVNYLEKKLRNDAQAYDIYPVLDYLKINNQAMRAKNILLKIFQDASYPNATRSFALSRWMRIDPKPHIEYLIKNFLELKKDSVLEISMAKIIATWKGSASVRLQDLILSQGSLRAQEIIANVRAEKNLVHIEKKDEKEKNDSEIFANAAIIHAIFELIDRINIVSLASTDFNFSLIEKTAGLSRQLKIATDQASFESACNHLRPIIQGCFSDEVHNHGIDIQTSRKILGGVDEQGVGKPGNGLFLYLASKNLKPPQDLFGLRNLNAVVNKLSHPEDKESLIVLLKANGWLELYKAQNWSELHSRILEEYKSSLDKLLVLIEKK